ncbi:MAG TPA: hypothetical protein VKT77_18455 [Chthonomonadaceae bacterium]|nr:hypothetical protein [Chthonomonadaceae bacterium]
MSLAIRIAAIVIGLIVAYWLLSALLGYLVGAVVCVGAALAVFALLRWWLASHVRSLGPDVSNVKRAEKHAEKPLKEMEREAARNRTD